MSSPSPRPRLSPRRKALFVALLLGVALVAAELAARALTEAPRPLFLAHPYVRRVRNPGMALPLRSPLDGREFVVTIDDHGFRSRSLEPPGTPKPPGTYRIFFVGGSTTENIALPDEETFPAIVEAELQPRVTPRLRCVNAGLSGNLVSDTFSIVAHRVLPLEPDLVVALEGINDMCAGLAGPDEEPRPLTPSSPGLLEGSRLAQLLGRVTDRLSDDGRAERLRARRLSSPFTPGLDPSRGLPRYRRYLRLLAAVCKDAGVPLLLLTMPSSYAEPMAPGLDARLWMGYQDHGRVNADVATMRRGLDLFNEATREVAREEGALLLDLAGALPKDLLHFYDDCHYTARGSRVVAERIMQFVAERGLP